MNREALWIILEKLGCPSEFVKLVRLFHDDMEACVNVGGILTDSFKVENGVKQGDILAPTLFSIFFSTVMANAFQECDQGIYINYRTTGKLFDIRRFGATTKTFQTLIRDLLYADDCDLVTHSVSDMQHLMNKINESCKAFGLQISLDKTVVMFQPSPNNLYCEPEIFIEDFKLRVVEKFPYLGSTMSHNCTLDEEIKLRLQKATVAFRGLESRVWSQNDITIKTKISIYYACVVTCLLYSCETWVIYRRHLKSLERFHQRCLRSILGIHWTTYTPTQMSYRKLLPSALKLKFINTDCDGLDTWSERKIIECLSSYSMVKSKEQSVLPRNQSYVLRTALNAQFLILKFH